MNTEVIAVSDFGFSIKGLSFLSKKRAASLVERLHSLGQLIHCFFQGHQIELHVLTHRRKCGTQKQSRKGRQTDAILLHGTQAEK